MSLRTPMGAVRMKLHLSDRVDPRMADADHGWWFPERRGENSQLFGVFESNANMLCPDGAEFCRPEIGAGPTPPFCAELRKRKGFLNQE